MRNHWRSLVKWVSLGLSIVIIATVSLIVFYDYGMFPPFSSEPALIKDLNYETRAHITSAQFNQRVQEQFSTQIDEDAAIQELENQGFEVERDRNRAVFSRSNISCTYEFSVFWWSSDDGTISEVIGAYSVICL